MVGGVTLACVRMDTGGVFQFASPEDEQRFRDGCTKRDVPRIDDGEEFF